MTTERHSIKPFRATKLGKMRLEKLAYPGKMVITIGGKNVVPTGYDTYGHPLFSRDSFEYYLAEKANAERTGESLVPIVEYEERPFCYKRELYDSEASLKKAIEVSEKETEEALNAVLANLKAFLSNRKQAAFYGNPLKSFVLYNIYLLAQDGHVYKTEGVSNNKEEVLEVNEDEISKLEEVHIPDNVCRCPICGHKFTINDVKNFNIAETDRCKKAHMDCKIRSKEAINHKMASCIIDSVYDGRPPSEIQHIDGITWYVYKTFEGDIRISFKTKVIVIEWMGNFKPFNMSIFDNEKVTKYDRGIHAWGKDKAINYLMAAKKA